MRLYDQLDRLLGEENYINYVPGASRYVSLCRVGSGISIDYHFCACARVYPEGHIELKTYGVERRGYSAGRALADILDKIGVALQYNADDGQWYVAYDSFEPMRVYDGFVLVPTGQVCA